MSIEDRIVDSRANEKIDHVLKARQIQELRKIREALEEIKKRIGRI